MHANLSRRVTLEKPGSQQDPTFRSASPSWDVLDTVWAEVLDLPPSRSTAVREGLLLGRQQVRVRIRWRDDIDASMRVRFGARLLRIVGGPAELGRRELLEILCEETTTSGGT